MKKILFILTSPSPFGAELSLLTNINYLKKNNKIDPIFIIRKEGKLEKYLKKKNYNYIVIPFNFWVSKKKNFLKSIIKLFINFLLVVYVSMLLRKHKIFYIYTNTFTTNFGLILSIFLRLKHIFHIRELAKEQFNWKFDYSSKLIFNFSSRFSYKIFVNSEYLHKKLKKKFKKKKIEIVPNSINQKFSQKNNYNFKNKLKLLFVGRIDDDKNPLILVKTVKEIIKKNKDFVIDVYGDGSLKSELINQINLNNLSNFIKVKNYKKDIFKIIRHYQIGLSLSRYDTFNRTIVEYMKSGLTVIANDSGNNKYLFVDGKTGVLIKNINEFNLSRKILFLIKKKKMIKKIGSNAYRYSKKKYLTQDSCKKLETYLSL